LRVRILFFYTILWQKSLSTLFRYTTLFRSCPAHLALDLAEDAQVPCLRSEPWHHAVVQHGELLRQRLAGWQASGGLHGFFFAAADRKSTRLNSSHVKISYAGFYLNKKKHEI